MGTVADRIAERDARTFAGRDAELAWLDRSDATVLLLHGPGGIGKSRLLRELGRRARVSARMVVSVDGRQVSSDPNAIRRVLGGLDAGSSPLILFDNWDYVSALGEWLREEIIPALPEQSLLVLAGRERPRSAWFTDGWETVSAELELQPMPDHDAASLVHALGVADTATVQSLVQWAKGWPLALALGAETGEPAAAIGPDMVSRLAALLVDEEVDAGHRVVLAVASIARVTTVELLAVVLPDRDPQEGFDWLSSRSFTEPIGRGLTVHDLVKRVLREQVRQRSPELDITVRRCVVDYLYRRALQEGTPVVLDLAHLVENPAIRWGFGETTSELWVSAVKPADSAVIERVLVDAGLSPQWEALRPFLEQTPDKAFVVRDRTTRPCGIAVCVTPGSAGPVAAADPILGGWLQHAEVTAPDGNAVLWQSATALTHDPEGRVQGMLGSGGVLRSGLHNPRYLYLPINPHLAAAVRFAESIGATHLPELDVVVGPLRTACYRADFGAGGMLGAIRDVVYSEIGLAPASGRLGAISPDDVRAALRDLHDPVALAASVLGSRLVGTAETVAERAERVATLLRDAADKAFGDGDEDKLRREVVRLTFLEPGGSHAATTRALHLGRATYFRRLREATERVTVWLSDQA